MSHLSLLRRAQREFSSQPSCFHTWWSVVNMCYYTILVLRQQKKKTFSSQPNCAGRRESHKPAHHLMPTENHQHSQSGDGALYTNALNFAGQNQADWFELVAGVDVAALARLSRQQLPVVSDAARHYTCKCFLHSCQQLENRWSCFYRPGCFSLPDLPVTAAFHVSATSALCSGGTCLHSSRLFITPAAGATDQQLKVTLSLYPSMSKFILFSTWWLWAKRVFVCSLFLLSLLLLVFHSPGKPTSMARNPAFHLPLARCLRDQLRSSILMKNMFLVKFGRHINKDRS